MGGRRLISRLADQCNFHALAQEHMPIDLIERGIRLPTNKPAHKGSVIMRNKLVPRLPVWCRFIDRQGTRCQPTRPALLRFAQPGAILGTEPMQLFRGDWRPDVLGLGPAVRLDSRERASVRHIQRARVAHSETLVGIL
eukprot:194176-Prymnesium_polylepis.1